MSISNYLENKILDKLFNNTDFTVLVPYVSLHTGDPGKTGANEANGMSYVRQAGSFTSAFTGRVDSDIDLYFFNLPSGTYSYTGVWDAIAGGNFLWGDPVLVERNINAGDGLVLYSGDLYITLD